MFSVKTVTSFFLKTLLCGGKIFVGLPTSETRAVCDGSENGEKKKQLGPRTRYTDTHTDCEKNSNETKDSGYFF